MKKKWRLAGCLFPVLLFYSLAFFPLSAEAIYDSPYVTWSPDGQAFTTNAGEKPAAQEPPGKRVATGAASALAPLREGEHYYTYERTGDVPVGEWVVGHPYAQCIHDQYPEEGSYYHGVAYGRERCGAYYHSGWTAYCADCGGQVSRMFLYLTEAAARGITVLDLRKEYFYLCPYCRNLEQGAAFAAHRCRAVSANRYRVRYDGNGGSGYMEPGLHMYNNAAQYEGRPVTPAARLSGNAYARTGYEFTGWDTRPDGTGEAFADGQEVLNLTAENYGGDGSGAGEVTLYAQWRRSEGTLHIDPAGGAYEGRAGATSVRKGHGSTYEADPARLEPPAGFRVRFETDGGSAVADAVQELSFREWALSQPAAGRLEGNVYHYAGPDGAQDTLTAVYRPGSITLPAPEKPGSSFGGWHYDPACTRPAGAGGDRLSPAGDLTLYAEWVDLALSSEENWLAGGGKGAVDLSWAQADGQGRAYLLYQSTDGREWARIHAADDVPGGRAAGASYGYTGAAQSYTAPYAGFYAVTAYGAQGGGWGGRQGGLGGLASATFWLAAGEELSLAVGGQGGSGSGGTGGWGGGGTGGAFAGGGGRTAVSTDRKGTVLVAGGGGGATSLEGGGAGGSSAGLRPDGAGEGASGGAGGGAGWRGGAAGTVAVHVHAAACRHVHTGSPSAGGGCYTVPVACGGASFAREKTGERFYYGNRDWDGSLIYCVRCGSYSCPGHLDEYFRYVCASCGAGYGSRPLSCTALSGYAPGCGRDEGYVCGYAQGQTVSSAPAYGGSSYASAAQASVYGLLPGQRAGDGAAAVTPGDVGYRESLALAGVPAPDLAPPGGVSLASVAREAPDAGHVRVSWERPADSGTVYYHRAESYPSGGGRKLCDSNVTADTLASGVMGYYWLADASPATEAGTASGALLEEAGAAPSLTLPLEEAVLYLHVAAVDAAGNVGPTAHIRTGTQDPEAAWGLATDRICVSSDGGGIYPAGEGAWYVRSDGATPFALSFRGTAERATPAYQVNHAVFRSSLAGGAQAQDFALYTASHAPSGEAAVSRPDAVRREASGASLLRDAGHTVTTRSADRRTLEAVQEFTLPAAYHGIAVQVAPRAGADFRGGAVWSVWEEDLRNAVTLTGDGEAPEVAGLEALEGLGPLLDRRDGSVSLHLAASDSLSGVAEFYVEAYNTDNHAAKAYRADGAHEVTVDITRDEPVFSGDFRITVHAADNVGNVREETYATTEFSLEAQVTRVLEPHAPAFRAGESGVLRIVSYGYADRVEVEFPEGMSALDPGLDAVFDYGDAPSWRQEEVLRFLVPLYAPEGGFQVTVRAYKGGKKLEEHPAVSVIGVSGSVLDGLRTRLR